MRPVVRCDNCRDVCKDNLDIRRYEDVADHDKEEIILTQKYYSFGQFTRCIRLCSTIIPCNKDTLAAYDPDTQTLADGEHWSPAEGITADDICVTALLKANSITR